jgi:hypothetical protein
VPVLGSTIGSANSSVPVIPYSVPFSSTSWTGAERGTAPLPASACLRAMMSALDCWMSTLIGSSLWMVVRAVGCPDVTSAPVVTIERPIRPLIGAGTRVNLKLI